MLSYEDEAHTSASVRLAAVNAVRTVRTQYTPPVLLSLLSSLPPRNLSLALRKRHYPLTLQPAALVVLV